jgi:hypothetical protein
MKTSYRTYARFDNQQVIHKTVTESKAVADFAWEELKSMKWDKDLHPTSISYTCNNKQIDSISLV